MGKKSKQAPEPLDELRELVALGDTNGSSPKKTDRRGMLRLAGAAVLGAAGIAAVKVIPAAAASGDNFILGCGNAATTDTTLINVGGAVGLAVTGAPHGLEGYGGGSTTSEVGVLGVSKGGTGIGVGGRALGIGTGVRGESTTGTGVVGVATTGTGVSGSAPTNGTGVLGSVGGSGTAVYGSGAGGRGVLGISTTGYDVQLGYPVPGGAVGSGRLAMVGRLDVGGSAPNIAPAFVTTTAGSAYFQHEFIRGNDSSIWASRFDGSSPNQTRWKRINAVRVDSADGLGSNFKPFRVVDTRTLGAIKANGTMNLVQVAGTGTGTSAIPPDAVAVIGNLTAAGYTGGGWLSIMPGGIVQGAGPGQYNPASDPSSVNFQVGQGAIANSFVVGLGSAGKVQVYVGGHSSHFIIDITGYMQ